MTASRVTALRHLIGLTRRELADEILLHQNTIEGWERGRVAPSARSWADLRAIYREHTRETVEYLGRASRGETVAIHVDASRPVGWYTAIVSRILDRHPEVTVGLIRYVTQWDDQTYAAWGQLQLAEKIFGYGIGIARDRSSSDAPAGDDSGVRYVIFEKVDDKKARIINYLNITTEIY